MSSFAFCMRQNLFTLYRREVGKGVDHGKLAHIHSKETCEERKWKLLYVSVNAEFSKV